MGRLTWMLLALLVSCAGSKYPRGARAFEDAQAPVKLVHQPAQGELASMEILVRAGSAHDPIGSEGLAYLTAHLLREGGAGERSGEAVQSALYRMGTDIEVVVDKEMVAFRVTCVAEDAPEVAALLGDMLIRPQLDPSALQRIRDNAKTHLQRGITQNDEALGDALLDARLYAGHGYGHPVQGRFGVIGNLDEADVRRFLTERYIRPAIVLGVAGAVSDEVIQGLRDRLSETPASLYRDVTPRPAPVGRARRVLIVEKETVATGIHLGHHTQLRRDHEDWPAMMLAAFALGEHRQAHGRLYQALRETRGLNYGDYAYVERYRQDGFSHRQMTGTGRIDNPFYVWVRPVAPENAPFALKGALDIVESWVKAGLTEDEFARMKTYMQARVVLWAADPARRLGWATEAALMGWPNPVETLPSAMGSLTREQVNQAIQRHVDPSTVDIVVVTADGEGFSSAIEGDAPTPIVYEGAAPSQESPQAKEDVRISEIDLDVEKVQIISTTDLFR